MARKHISFKTKLASALLALDDVPYLEAKQMTEDEFISRYQFDHNILHAVEVVDHFSNLRPMLIAAHREKSRADAKTVAKVRRIDEKWGPFMSAVASRQKPPKRQKRRWRKRF